VRTHLENIYDKLQVSSRTAAVTCAMSDRAAMDSAAAAGIPAEAAPSRPAGTNPG
jgi:hypothetical protein